jgi:hypothetical protein
MPSDTADHEQHLKLLSIFHYIVGGLMGLFACFPLIHVAVGIMVVVSPGMFNNGGHPLPELFGWLFIIAGATFALVGWTMATCALLAGRFLSRHVHYTYCLVVAAVECIFMPFGTVLGVFTLIVLTKSHVKEMFEVFPHVH